MPYFGRPRFIRNTFSLNIDRRSDVRRFAERFEAVLGGDYGVAQVTPIPDQMEPLLPRLIFSSTHGFSQILVSQMNIAFIVNYSEDWQTNSLNRNEYVRDRARYLFQLAENLQTKALFCGLNTEVQVPAVTNEEHVISLLKKKLLSADLQGHILHDLTVRTSVIIDEKFFSNLTISNFRTWGEISTAQENRMIVRLPDALASQTGITISNDFNDRYSFNEQANYVCDYDSAQLLLRVASDHLDKSIKNILGDVE